MIEIEDEDTLQTVCKTNRQVGRHPLHNSYSEGKAATKRKSCGFLKMWQGCNVRHLP